MTLSSTFARVLVNRLLVAGAALGGLGLVVAGFVLGLWDAVQLLLENPLDPGAAYEQANPVVTLIFVVLGYVVWQVGKTYAQFQVTAGSSDGNSGADAETLEEIRDRLSKIESDLEETREGVRKLQRETHTAAFDEAGASGTGSGESGRGADAARTGPSTAAPRNGTTADAARNGTETDRGTDGTASERRSTREETGEFDFSEDRERSGSDANGTLGEEWATTGAESSSDDESDPLA